MSFAEWNLVLLLSALLFVIGCVLSVVASTLRERVLAVGVLVQAIVLVLIANGAFHSRSDLALAAITLLSLFGLWALLAISMDVHVEVDEESAVAVVASTEQGASRAAKSEAAGRDFGAGEVR